MCLSKYSETKPARTVQKQLYDCVVKMIQLIDSWFNDPFDIKEHTTHTSYTFWSML